MICRKGMIDIDVMIEYLDAHPVINATIDNRIKRLNWISTGTTKSLTNKWKFRQPVQTKALRVSYLMKCLNLNHQHTKIKKILIKTVKLCVLLWINSTFRILNWKNITPSRYRYYYWDHKDRKSRSVQQTYGIIIDKTHFFLFSSWINKPQILLLFIYLKDNVHKDSFASTVHLRINMKWYHLFAIIQKHGLEIIAKRNK